MAFQSIFEPFEQQASPFTANDTLGTMFTAPKKKKRQRRQGQAATAEEESALRKIGQMGLSGITTASATLDIPGGAIRNTLVGKLPGSDPFSFEGRASGRDVLEHYLPISKNIEGFHPIDEPMDALLDVAGFATEVGLDPLTYLSFGGSAVSKAGKAFKKAGLWDFLPEAASKAGQGRMAGRMGQTPRSIIDAMPKDIRASALKKFAGVEKHYSKAKAGELLDKPIGGAATFWPTGTALGKAEGIGGQVAKLLDPIGDAVRYGKYSPVRGAYAAFSPAMQGKTHAELQRTLKHQAAKSAFREMEIKQKWHGRVAEAAEMGHIGEGPEAIKHARMDRAFGEGIEGVSLQNDRMEGIMREVADEGKEQLEAENLMGLSTSKLEDHIDYIKRQRTTFDYQLAPGQRTLMGATHPSMTPRKNVLKGSPLGTEFANILSLDPKISGIAHAKTIGPRMSAATRKRLEMDLVATQGVTAKKAKEIVRNEFPRTSSKAVDLDKATKYIHAEYGDVLPPGFTKENVYELAQTVSEWDRRHAILGTPIFAHHPIIDSMERELLGQKATANAESVYELLGQFAKRRQDMLPEEGRMSIVEALTQANLTGSGSHKQMMDRLPKGIWGETKKTLQDINRTIGVDPSQISSETILNNIYIPKSVADDVIGLGKTFSTQDVSRTIMHQMGEFYDSWLSFFRGHVTSYWPAFMTRNMMSGQIQNMIGGAYGANIFGRSGMASSLRDVLHAMKGKDIPNVLDIPIVREAGITDAKEATRFVMTRLSGGGLGGRLQTEFASHMGKEAAATAKDIFGEIPGVHPWTMKETAGKLIPGSRGGRRPGWLNMRKMHGVGDTKETEFFLSQFGNDMGWVVETLNRFAPAISMLRRGIDPIEAVNRVKLLQVDYMAKAAGDKTMRRMVPFWSFVKGQSKYLAEELTQKPGGVLAQTIRAESLMQREGLPQALPDYLQQSANIPLGESAEGDPRLLTSLGLMHEDPLQFLASKKGSIPETLGNMFLTAGREALGRATPLAKAVLEPLTGVSTWQYGPRGGRNVEDMYGYLGGFASKATGREVKLPAFVENIPQLVGFGRHLSTAGQLAHPDRAWWVKALNVGAGPKVTTIRPHMQDRVIEENIQEKMQKLGAKQYKKMYFPKSLTKDLPEEELQKRNELKALNSAMQRRRRERAAQQPLF